MSNHKSLRAFIDGKPLDLANGPHTVPRGAALSVDLSSGGHWYGHGFSHVQPLPLETGSIANPSFAVNNIQCPAWMCSAGYVLFADTTEVLDVRVNEGGDGLLRVRCDAAGFPLRVFRGLTLPDAHARFLSAVAWPNGSPDNRLFGDSIFCTWTQYPRCITQSRVLDMARQIRAREYPCSTLIIDDRWESCFGELAFSRYFPDPRAMLAELHRMGFSVWLWVTPFVNVESAVFDDLSRRGILVRRADGSGAALLKWWGGTAGLIDLTGDEGREWLRARLLHLRDEIGADGFKVDGGDFKYQPALADSAWRDYSGPSGYSDALLALVESVAPWCSETRTAWLSQRRRILWREGGKDSHWALDNGLAALVTYALQMSLLGYDIVMPDMVPGRVQTLVEDFPLPTDELMVRWTEASVLMPLLQFSYFPWNYAEPAERAVRSFALLHNALGPYLASSAANRSKPLLRPLWYDSPAESSLYRVADEFLLGPDLLAAPVLSAGAVERDVVIPPGDWLDAWTGASVSPGLHKRFPSPCPGIPLFVRASNRPLTSTLRSSLSQIARGTVATGLTTTTWRCGLTRDISTTG